MDNLPENKKRKAEDDLTSKMEKKLKTDETKKKHLWLLYDSQPMDRDCDILYRFTWTQPGDDAVQDVIKRPGPSLPPQIQTYIKVAVPPGHIMGQFIQEQCAMLSQLLDELPVLYIRGIQGIIFDYAVSRLPPKLARLRHADAETEEPIYGSVVVDLYDEKGNLMAFEPEDPKTDVIVYYDPALLCDSSELPK